MVHEWFDCRLQLALESQRCWRWIAGERAEMRFCWFYWKKDFLKRFGSYWWRWGDYEVRRIRRSARSYWSFEPENVAEKGPFQRLWLPYWNFYFSNNKHETSGNYLYSCLPLRKKRYKILGQGLSYELNKCPWNLSWVTAFTHHN